MFSEFEACVVSNGKSRDSLYYQKKYRTHSSREKVLERKNLLERDFSTATINESG
jgi:hypothetical protein